VYLVLSPRNRVVLFVIYCTVDAALDRVSTKSSKTSKKRTLLKRFLFLSKKRTLFTKEWVPIAGFLTRINHGITGFTGFTTF